jgi:hypothetical protein
MNTSRREKGEDMSLLSAAPPSGPSRADYIPEYFSPQAWKLSLTESGRSHALCALMVHLVATAAGNRSFSICYPILYPISPAGDIFVLVSEIGNFRVLSGEIKITHEDSASPVSAVPCFIRVTPLSMQSFCLYAGVGFRDE